MKVLIVGGVAGGASAAARLRRLDEHAEIILFEKSSFISYANCGLPYYIGGVIADESALTLQTPESFRRRFRIDVRVRSEVKALYPERKTVAVQNLESGERYEETYDRLILSPGARPVRPPIPGVDEKRVFTLRNVEDTLRIKSFIKQQRPVAAVVVGGGYIGLEMAENLFHAGLKVTVVERMPQILMPLDYDMACEVQGYLREQGLRILTGESVTEFKATEDGLLVRLEKGEDLRCDLAILAAGVAPDTRIAKEAGLALGWKDAILVNDQMETSMTDIYAVGDAVQVRHFVTGQPDLISLAGPANKQGRIAADRICGRDSHYNGSQGSSVIRLFGMTVAATGINERTAGQKGIVCDAAVTFSPSHATYYPGAKNMTVKTLFDPASGKILGAQIVGFDGVDKRCDIMATAIRAGMTGEELAELELCYAPPYSSAKDPVNMAGFVIENVRAGLVKQWHWHTYADVLKREKTAFLDVRTEREFARGHISGAVNIPLDDLRERLAELDQSVSYYVNCHSGLRSYLACRILMQNGFDCYNLSGGYRYFEMVEKGGGFDATPRHACGAAIDRGGGQTP